MAVGDMITSPVWGNVPEPITQGFGPALADPSWYAYAADYGVPAGTHPADDIGVSKFTPIYALDAGTVMPETAPSSGAPSDSFRPYPVWIQTDNGAVEIYGHLWQNFVRPGQRVTAGEELGLSGEQTVPGTLTPDGSGPHLHFELRIPDSSTSSGYRAIDPTPYLSKSGVRAMSFAGSVGGVIANATGIPAAIGHYMERGVLVVLGIMLLSLGAYALVGSGNVTQSITKHKGIAKVAIAAV